MLSRRPRRAPTETSARPPAAARGRRLAASIPGASRRAPLRDPDSCPVPALPHPQPVRQPRPPLSSSAPGRTASTASAQRAARARGGGDGEPTAARHDLLSALPPRPGEPRSLGPSPEGPRGRGECPWAGRGEVAARMRGTARAALRLGRSRNVGLWTERGLECKCTLSPSRGFVSLRTAMPHPVPKINTRGAAGWHAGRFASRCPERVT